MSARRSGEEEARESAGREEAPLRVAVVTEEPPGGPVLALLEFLSGIHDVAVHSNGAGPDPALPAGRAGSRLRMRPMPGFPVAAFRELPASPPQTAAVFGEADVTVLLEDMSAAALLAGTVRERLGGKLFLLAHQENHFPRVTPLNQWSLSVRNLVHRSADAIAAFTERARDVLVVERGAKDEIAVLSPGVDTVRFSPDPVRRERARARLGLRRGEPAVVFVGRMAWDDGVFDLLHAAKLLALSGEPGGADVRYMLFGGGEEAGRVRDMVEETGLSPAFRMFEDPPGCGDPDLCNGADVIAVPAVVPRPWNQGLGGSVMEAMACGCAIVAADSGSMREIVGDAGVLVPPGDPRAFAGALGMLLRDDAVREGLGTRARRRAVERFDGRRAALGLSDALRRVVRG